MGNMGQAAYLLFGLWMEKCVGLKMEHFNNILSCWPPVNLMKMHCLVWFWFFFLKNVFSSPEPDLGHFQIWVLFFWLLPFQQIEFHPDKFSQRCSADTKTESWKQSSESWAILHTFSLTFLCIGKNKKPSLEKKKRYITVKIAVSEDSHWFTGWLKKQASWQFSHADY